MNYIKPFKYGRNKKSTYFFWDRVLARVSLSKPSQPSPDFLESFDVEGMGESGISLFFSASQGSVGGGTFDFDFFPLTSLALTPDITVQF